MVKARSRALLTAGITLAVGAVVGGALLFASNRQRPAARQAVPAGSKVVVDEKSWVPDGVGGGTIKVTVTAPGKPPVSYATVVVSEDDRGKVLATFPLSTKATKSGASGASSP